MARTLSRLGAYPLLLAGALILAAPGASRAQPDAGSPPAAAGLDALYDRLAADLLAGRPLVATMYVALCDGEVQGLIPPKDRRVCRGDRIEDAVADFLRAAGSDEPLVVALPDGGTLEAGGRSHVLGYLGHDYLMDVIHDEHRDRLFALTGAGGTLPRGVFALSCLSNDYFRPALEREHLSILALNRQFTFPSAFAAAGIVGAVAAGKDRRGIRREATRAYARGQKRPLSEMGGVFAN